MRVLLCPDKFAGTLPAPEVAAAVAAGWRPVHLGDRVLRLETAALVGAAMLLLPGPIRDRA